MSIEIIAPDLASIRQEIDRLDDDIHRSLIKRAQLVESVAAAKGLDRSSPGTLALRPAREAEILARRLEHNQSQLPPATIARIWREIVAAMTLMQGPIEVLVGTQTKSVGYFELAREFFGSAIPMALHSSPVKAVREASHQTGSIAVVPMPEFEEEEAWWPLLAAPPFKLRIIGRLPLIEKHVGRFEDLQALLVCGDPVDLSQSNVFCLVITSTSRVTPMGFAHTFEAEGLKAETLAIQGPNLGQDYWRNLLVVRGMSREDDPKFIELCAKNHENWRDVTVIGGYIEANSNPV